MSIRNKLNRLKPHMSVGKHNGDPGWKREEKEKKEIPFLQEWNRLNAVPYYSDEQYCFIREVSYPIDERHGKYRFSQFLEAVEAWNDSDVDHPLSAKGYSPGQLFFFDTETTGLGGGAGNTIFLLGYASFQGDKVIVRQHILPQPGAEIPLYKSFLENIKYDTLVTYNGKAFDWPQVKTRHTLIREHLPRLPSFGHFDLYHASRRMWKHRLDRLKLSVVEKEILNIERKDDIPGYLAPMIYFDFVERKDPEGMAGVLKHNELDILSLICLYTHLSFQLLSLDKNQSSLETYEVGRWYAYIGENKAAKDAFSKIAGNGDLASIKAKFALSLQLKKQKDWEPAVQIWKELAQCRMWKTAHDSAVELAKYYEHTVKDLAKAYEYTIIARKVLDNRGFLLKEKDLKMQEELDKRMDRLKKKMARKKQ